MYKIGCYDCEDMRVTYSTSAKMKPYFVFTKFDFKLTKSDLKFLKQGFSIIAK